MKEVLKQFGKFQQLTPETNEAFQGWNAHVFKEGALSHKFKELVAIACAATTGCDYCLDVHTDAAISAGVTEEEMAEALMVVTANKAGASFAHGANALNAFEEIDDDVYFKRSYKMKMMELKEYAPEDAKAFFNFTMNAGADGVLTVKEKELIATASALITACPYCIETHVQQAKEAGATKQEISEIVFIASALQAGSAFSKTAKVLQKFDS